MDVCIFLAMTLLASCGNSKLCRTGAPAAASCVISLVDKMLQRHFYLIIYIPRRISSQGTKTLRRRTRSR